MSVVWLVYRILVGLLFVPTLFVFVGTLSVSQVVNENNIDIHLENATTELLGTELNDSYVPGDDFNIGLVHNNLQTSCINKDNVTMDMYDVVIDCSDLGSTNSNELPNLVKQELGERIKTEVDKTLGPWGFDFFDIEIDSLESYFGILTLLIIISGMLTAILLIGSIFLSLPKYTATVSIGLVGAISGIPAFFIRDFDLSAFHGDLSVSTTVMQSLQDILFQNYLVTFVLGTTLLVIGLVWLVSVYIGFFWMKREMEADMEEEEARKEELRKELPDLYKSKEGP